MSSSPPPAPPPANKYPLASLEMRQERGQVTGWDGIGLPAGAAHLARRTERVTERARKTDRLWGY